MAQGSYILRTESAGQNTEKSVPNYLGIDYGYQWDVDNLKFVNNFQPGDTIKRLSLKRRPRVAANNEESKPSASSSSQWHSEEASASLSSDDTRLLGMSSSTRGRPPLPPPHGSPSDNKPCGNDRAAAASQTPDESKPRPAARSLASQRPSPVLEKTSVETLKHSDQEVSRRLPPQPHPRRRLASFGGVSSHGSRSPFTGLGAYNQNNNGNKPAGSGSDVNVHRSSSMGSRGSTGCLRLGAQSSGRTASVTSLGPTHLQHVRDQMVVALQRLKELEEQVTIIPILQVRIAVLQEEKRQLVSQFKTRDDNEDAKDVIWKRARSADNSDIENTVNVEEGLEGTMSSDCGDLKEFRELTEEIHALEITIKSGHLEEWNGKDSKLLLDKTMKSVAVGTDEDTDTALSKPKKENKYVHTDRVEMRSVGTEVSEVNLGIYTEREAEIDAQQLIINASKERICQLETQLKESALQTEMSRLKLELLVAGARNRADKASFARPSTVSTGTETRPHTTSQGVGNHTELRDASTGDATEVKTVGVSCCGAEMNNVCTGPDVPMCHWEVRERVETAEKGVGIQVLTNTQGVGMEIKLCDAETNTEAPQEKRKIESSSVGCGDCSVDVIICRAKEVVSQGTATDQVKGVDLGIMASPQTACQRNNTVSCSVSRFTNTRHAFSTDSSTNTVLCTQNKHTNTTQAVTRTVSVGKRVKDPKPAPETRTVGVGTENLPGSAFKQTPGTVARVTRDAGVGFTNFKENFLVGLKTRNMASGPSHLPDPVKTRSIGVGEGRIRDLAASSSSPGQTIQRSPQSQWEPGLNHYIEKMHWLLREHGDLLTEDLHGPQRDGFAQQRSSRGKADADLSRDSKAATQRETEVYALDSQQTVGRELQSPSQLLADSSDCDKANQAKSQHVVNDSEVRRMIQMLEQQTSSAALRDVAVGSVIKKQNGEQGCSGKSMTLMRVTTGSSHELPPSEKAHSEVLESRRSKKSSEASQDGRKGKGNSKKESRCSSKSHSQRGKISETMFSACQALKVHLSDSTALSSGELHDCLQTLRHDWFSVSGHKSAAPDTVADYLSAFRVISPAVLQHVANLVDDNGNTALHYSVSNSNFGVVKKLLDAGVCNVNQQNKAGYTPIMLAALAAVESYQEMRVVEELFAEGDVNAKAGQAGQTALMLAASHGRRDVAQALLARGAEVNLRDDEGSTALMCASEHGHADVAGLLLARPDCDATLTDGDDSTALSIALEAGHNDIAVLLYARANFSRGQAGAAARLGGSTSPSVSAGRNPFE
uniref:KN motif and ankyrin repeat domains 1b n=1 Tax=Gasterosteus aculeatus aculeatus TaxID=481459 RepID=G3PTJ6_GASAC|nr:KN motif and ankyrin repeat domain-containing protein 1-like [Gasterosteus aculeatus aculeatus]XP_040053956.1 KN motif and ankyrin repeat domain-containing protein 1-like [Gasterosteus aculeatus aculeatus]